MDGASRTTLPDGSRHAPLSHSLQRRKAAAISRASNVAAHATRRAARPPRVAAVGAAVASAGTAPHVLLAGALRTSLQQITADHFISLVGVLCSVPLAFILPSLIYLRLCDDLGIGTAFGRAAARPRLALVVGPLAILGGSVSVALSIPSVSCNDVHSDLK